MLNGDETASVPAPVQVVLNWIEELKDRVPVPWTTVKIILNAC